MASRVDTKLGYGVMFQMSHRLGIRMRYQQLYGDR